MNSEHDLIYGSHKIVDTANQDSANDVPQYYRSYGRIHLEQLQADVSIQNRSAIFGMTDPDDQLQHFNQIDFWLLSGIV
jgi:hypothetical protein